MTRAWAFLVACLLIVGRSGTAQQPSTSDAVEALLRGDYARAAEILQPIAERSRRRDQVAEFFMATLYENGRGLSTDLTRACALYARAGSEGGRSALAAQPFAAQADILRQRLFASIGKEGANRCAWLANTGMDSRFQPVTFTLAPGHWISWDERGATISYEGRQKRFDGLIGVSEAVYLPLQYTELTTGPLRATRRHFVEAFFWMPLKNNEWMLQWRLFEVFKDTLVTVTADSLVTETLEDPRSAAPFDVRQVVRLRVNEQGNAEWAIFQGTKAHTAVIETQEERAEKRQRDIARREAAARVDWNRLQDVHRTPSLTYPDGDGCGGVFLYGWSADRSEVIDQRRKGGAATHNDTEDVRSFNNARRAGGHR